MLCERKISPWNCKALLKILQQEYPWISSCAKVVTVEQRQELCIYSKNQLIRSCEKKPKNMSLVELVGVIVVEVSHKMLRGK